MEVKQSELINADVTVILNNRHGAVINGSSGVISGMASELGVGVLGRMTLGD